MQQSVKQQEWQQVFSLQCSSTPPQTKLASYGDWQFTLQRLPLTHLTQPLQPTIIQLQKQNDCLYSGQKPRQDIKVQSFPGIKTVKEAFEQISVRVDCTKKEFVEEYGFWEVSGFRVYGRHGNGSTCSFEAEGYAYVGYYYTS